MIYYTRVDSIQAVTADGKQAWRNRGSSGYQEFPPVLSPGGGYVFLKDAAYAADNGALLDLGGLVNNSTEFTDRAFVTGADGRNYLRSGHEIRGWRLSEAGVEVGSPAAWNWQGSVVYFPVESGITPEKLIWHFYSSDFGDTRIAWLDMKGRLAANVRIPTRFGRLVGVDQESRTYFCAPGVGGPDCYATGLDSDKPLWALSFPVGGSPAGGALIPDRMYITTQAGYLFAVQSRGVESPAP
jgi:hypothetical protein